MITWTFKPILTGLVLALAGCQQAGLPVSEAASTVRKGETDSLTSVVIGAGRIALRAPAGYCIDPASVDASGRNGFAMLARCDLVKKSSATAVSGLRAPALITVTTRPWSGEDTEIAIADLAAAYPAEDILDQRSGPPVTLIRVSGGGAELDGVDEIHWRGALVVNDQLVALALFAPTGNAILGAGGGTFLSQLGRRIAKDSAKLTAGQ